MYCLSDEVRKDIFDKPFNMTDEIVDVCTKAIKRYGEIWFIRKRSITAKEYEEGYVDCKISDAYTIVSTDGEIRNSVYKAYSDFVGRYGLDVEVLINEPCEGAVVFVANDGKIVIEEMLSIQRFGFSS